MSLNGRKRVVGHVHYPKIQISWRIRSLDS